MVEQEWLAERFEDHRAHLRAVAYRMLGSVTEEDDAVQETWLRLSRSDTSVENPRAGLTTVVVSPARPIDLESQPDGGDREGRAARHVAAIYGHSECRYPAPASVALTSKGKPEAIRIAARVWPPSSTTRLIPLH